ncbi:MAG: site-specific DNA-methyltransferase [Planctomycetes bacterium]|uniref:DNA-methyltransferase n=1 Tax=Candidatus Wunengus californicus TaxID=3367619 RepID=UPI0040255D39|nr:site-specific DNA-methyltransferase [Planctomycetota bacterium]
MPGKTRIKSGSKAKQKTAHTYNLPGNPIEFYISEETSAYEKERPFSIYYDDPTHSVKLLKGDCITILNQARENSVDMIFADPPYFLSNGGITCHAGRMVSVNKGKWDKSRGVKENHQFTFDWLRACQRVLKPDGTIWVSGTTHIIYSVGFAMQELGYKILNDIVWYKRNAPPNLSCRYFTHSTEIVLWAAKNEKSKHYFDYQLMKKFNNGKQMRNLWQISAPPAEEKKFGKHPTQKPVELLTRIILASTKENNLVLDPFCGSSTTGVTSILLNRKYVGIDFEEEYLHLSKKRIEDVTRKSPLFERGEAVIIKQLKVLKESVSA